MWKLTPRFVLPASQLATAVALLQSGYVAYLPKGMDTAYVPTGRLICDGINAPARLITNFIEATYPEQWHWRIVGSKIEILMFLLFTIPLWYLVGRELELLLSQAPPSTAEFPASGSMAFFLLSVFYSQYRALTILDGFRT